jgi:hypothetical protein
MIDLFNLCSTTNKANKANKERQMKALLHKHTGEEEIIELSSFEQAQTIVGGLVEIAYPNEDDGLVFLINENGRIFDLPKNKAYPIIRGNVMIVSSKELSKLPYTTTEKV